MVIVMIRVVSGNFTETQLINITELATDGHVKRGKNHFYLTPDGNLSWVTDRRYREGDYDHPRVLNGNVKLGVVRVK
jgi:hypothetical protein